MERRVHNSMCKLLQQEHYTPEELNALLEIGMDIIRHAAFTGESRRAFSATTTFAFTETRYLPGSTSEAEECET